MAPRNVVVTGSTRGIGYGLAEAFLRLGCAVTVGGLRPGTVATDLLRDRYKGRLGDWEHARKIFNILAERVERVTPWLAQQMLANQKNGVILPYSSPWKMFWKFLRNPFVKEQVFN